MQVTTQVLDAAHGRPASDVMVRREAGGGDAWRVIGHGRTAGDGRIDKWGVEEFGPGHYRLIVDAGGFFATLGLLSSQTHVTVAFVARALGRRYHMPVLLAPFGYTTCTSEEP